MAQITNFDREFLIHALELKFLLFEVCIGSHSLAMFAKEFYGRAGYVDDPLPNTEYCCLGACLHCMTLLCIQLGCVVALGPFFSA